MSARQSDDEDAPRDARRELRAWLRALLLAFLVVAPFRSAVADWNTVPTGSMRPTIEPGDRIVVDRRAYDLKVPFTTLRLARWATPDRGDVVVLRSPVDGILLTKRVVGLPGDVVALRRNRLSIDGERARYRELGETGDGGLLLREEVAGHARRVRWDPARPVRRDLGPLRVPPGHYLLLGDARDASADSRVFGPVDRELILGRVLGTGLSFDPDGWFDLRWERSLRELR